jgi:hypothetical protein
MSNYYCSVNHCSENYCSETDLRRTRLAWACLELNGFARVRAGLHDLVGRYRTLARTSRIPWRGMAKGE